MLQHKLVDITTVKGIATAERLKANGWRIVRSGMFTMLFEKRTPRRKRRA